MAAMSKRTFGVEFELFIPYTNIRALQKKYPQLHVDWIKEDSYPAYVRNEEDVVEQLLSMIGLSHWNLHEDGSIDPGQTPAISIEVVTPILQGEKGIAEVKKFCDFFSTFGKVNNSCGTHVHVDGKDFKQKNKAAERLTLALLHYSSLEKVFDSLVHASRRKNKAYYAQGPGDEEEIIQRYKSLIQEDSQSLIKILSHLGPGRYAKLNLQSLQKHGTLEFRQLQGTLNATLIVNWIKIVTAFVDMIIKTEKDFKEMFKALSIVEKPPEINAEKEIITTFGPGKDVARNIKHHFFTKILDSLPRTVTNSIFDDIESIRFQSNAQIKFSKPIMGNGTFQITGDFSEVWKNLRHDTRKVVNQLFNVGVERLKALYTHLGLSHLEREKNNNLVFTFKTNIFIANSMRQPKLAKVSPQDVAKVKQTIGTVNKPGTVGVPKHIPSASVQAIQNLKEDIDLLLINS